MEFIMEMIKMVAYLVWIGVGITIIGSIVYYIAISRPMLKNYTDMMKDLSSDIRGEA